MKDGRTDLNVDVFVGAKLTLVGERVAVKVDLGVVVRVLLLVHVRGEDSQSHVVEPLFVKVAGQGEVRKFLAEEAAWAHVNETRCRIVSLPSAF